MKTVTDKEFKAKCSKLINMVSESGEWIEITKEGKVFAVLHPPKEHFKSGYAKGEFEIVGDTVAPLELE